jgi:hypothetical protein
MQVKYSNVYANNGAQRIMPCCLLLCGCCLQAKLEEKERKHFLKTKGISFEGAHISGSSSSSSLNRTQHALFAEQRDGTAMASI